MENSKKHSQRFTGKDRCRAVGCQIDDFFFFHPRGSRWRRQLWGVKGRNWNWIVGCPSIGRLFWVAPWTSFQDRWMASYWKNIWCSHVSKWILPTSSLNDTPYDWTQRIRHSTETFFSLEEVCWSRDPTCFLNGLSQAFFMSRFDMSPWFHACP